MDYGALTAPIPGQNPAGLKLYEMNAKLEELRKRTEESKEDPFAAPIEKKADWAGIVKLASDALCKSSKDLLIAARLVEARAQQGGFSGLVEGLKLLNLLVADCWDRMYPLIPEDLDLRAGPFEWLFEREGGAWFPASVRKLPLVKFGGMVVGRADCETGTIAGQAITKETVQPATPQTAQEIADCLKELETLDNALIEKMAEAAPSVAGLRESLKECLNFLGHLGAAPAEETNAMSAAADAAPVQDAAAPMKIDGPTSRAEMYKLLARLADNLAAMEPHSPIPDLLRWAVKLGNMPFRELIKELVREPGALAGIRRQFGIKNPEESDGG